MSNVDINVDRRTDGRKIGRLYRTLLQAGAIKMTTYVVGAHKKCHTEVLLMSTYNMCFMEKIRKKNVQVI